MTSKQEKQKVPSIGRRTNKEGGICLKKEKFLFKLIVNYYIIKKMSKYTYHSIEDQDQNMKSWFKPKIDPKILKDLTKRKDSPGWINTITYFSILIISGYIAFLTWGTWWALPAFFVYGTIYAFSNAILLCGSFAKIGDPLNDFFYYISSFFSYFEPVSWRWSHTHHHSRTIHQEIGSGTIPS